MNATADLGAEAAVLALGGAACVGSTALLAFCLWGAVRGPDCGCLGLLAQWCLVRCCPRVLRGGDFKAALLEDIEEAEEADSERRAEEAALTARRRLRAARAVLDERGDDDDDAQLAFRLAQDDYERALHKLPPDRRRVWMGDTNKSAP